MPPEGGSQSEPDWRVQLRTVASDPAADLASGEIWWRDHQKWLEEQGYMLRPRYRPSWTPSWRETKQQWFDCEDAQVALTGSILDATRLSDGEMVTLKRVQISIHPYEREIAEYFTTGIVAKDPKNHCVSIYKVLEPPGDPDDIILVMPLLRKFYNPPFYTVGEVVDFLSQIFEAFQFMHEHLVAHRDCTFLNIMMDPKPMYPNMYHPIDTWRNRNFEGDAKYYTRTARPTRYYVIDFGISRRYKASDAPFLEDVIQGGDRSVPEHQNPTGPCNPFQTDVYYIGNAIDAKIIQAFVNVDFVIPLVKDMTQADPKKRPTLAEVVDRFVKIRSTLGSRKLRSRLIPKNETGGDKVSRGIYHLFWTVSQISLRRAAIPNTK